jgi:uncharacterized radical SAM superfamily protein
MSWLETAGEVEPLEGACLDAALVSVMERRRGHAPGGKPIHFYTPGFKAYATSEISSCGANAWLAVSVTGGECELLCDHCQAKILEPMIPARTPEALWQVVSEQAAAGARGILLTGGSNRRNEVDYGPFYPTLRRIKDRFPGFRIALHTALVDEAAARRMEQAGADIAMMDVIGAQDTVTQVYHLKRPVEDFEHSLAALAATSMKVVPHVVIGLHYGRLLGEWRALEMLRRYPPDAAVLVVAMPFYASAQRPFAVPGSAEVGAFFADAREALPEIPLLLGCARPAGRVKSEIDAYALMAGLDGIAHPADGVVELAVRLGRGVKLTPACCSMAVGEEMLPLQDGAQALTLDVDDIIARERARRRAGLRSIPIVAADSSVAPA